ncbi:anaphase-promoting complex subunit 11 [Ephemerocybe angulata]|uniref:Anaphase-promoting complex subunit 11 n=1 Tax=Ephemerocybe angulata TaxID=980116 RepID=A0A8H6HBL8_9AGAR|nr:anaphase-promoting complex subunit 11 [Tulosesus angulatus]
MKVKVKHWHAVASWRWDTGKEEEEDEEADICGICRAEFEACCPLCKTPGDDCPLIYGECTHVFHMHCMLKWLERPSSKQQCPMDRREWKVAGSGT